MNIYIDLGAYNGDTFLEFMCREELNPETFNVYLFEPNPSFTRVLNNLINAFPNIKGVINKAAWIKDGKQEFAQDINRLAYGSTLMPTKAEIWDIMPKIEVETIDFSEWIKQFKNDFVIVKCDIEGAEFEVMGKMIKDDTLKIVNELWIETHPNKLRDITTAQSNEFIDKLQDHTKVELWH